MIFTRIQPLPPSRRDEEGKVDNGKAIITLILFFLSNAAVIFPVRVPIHPWVTSRTARAFTYIHVLSPKNKEEYSRRRYVKLNYITVPLFSVLLLLAIGAIDRIIIRKGILGDDGIKPIDTLALFISLAYISISLDFTGLLRFLAFWVAKKGGSSGRLLYLYLYSFFLISGVIVGNDPVILSGTAFLAYFTRVSGITPPTAWIFSQFAAANMASVVLVSSNPTNLVLSGAFSISFISYTAHVILPFLAAAVLVFPVLAYVLFRSPELVPLSLSVPSPYPDGPSSDHTDASLSAALVDKSGAIFGSILLGVTLGVLVGTSTVGVPVWEVTVPAALVMVARDIWHDYEQEKKERRRRGEDRMKVESSHRSGDIPMHVIHGAFSQEKSLPDLQQVPSEPPTPPQEPLPRSTPSPHPHPHPRFDLETVITNFFRRLHARFPTVYTIAQRLPVSLLPFAFLMFILVQGLSGQGWVEVFTRWWAAWARKTGTLGAIGGMGFITSILCNICGTNIGATILLARVLQTWFSQTPSLDPRIRDGAIYALAIGSNYGAFTLTFSASLAGLLWRQILRQKGIRVRPGQFLLLNIPIAFVAMLASSAALVGVVYVKHHKDTVVS